MMFHELPKPGDVLVSNPSATLEHLIWIVPQQLHRSCGTQTKAIDEARELGERLGVDVWLTEDQTHFLRVASFRV